MSCMVRNNEACAAVSNSLVGWTSINGSPGRTDWPGKTYNFVTIPATVAGIRRSLCPCCSETIPGIWIVRQ